jgi:MacB-like periplasmic core domain
MRSVLLTLALTAATGSVGPAGQTQDSARTFTIEGRGAGAETVEAGTSSVGPDYFRQQRIPLVAGRLFTDRDNREAPLVAIVNDVMAKRAWPGVDPIGRRLTLGDPASKSGWMTVVGVTADPRTGPPDRAAQPHVYTCSLQALTSRRDRAPYFPAASARTSR